MESVQRLRRRRRQPDTLKTTEQQVVTTQAVVDDTGAPTPQQIIIVQPANPQVGVCSQLQPDRGLWRVALSGHAAGVFPPPPGYAFGSALFSGMAFAAGGRGRRFAVGMGLGRTRAMGRRQRQRQRQSLQPHHRQHVDRSKLSGNQWRARPRGRRRAADAAAGWSRRRPRRAERPCRPTPSDGPTSRSRPAR